MFIQCVHERVFSRHQRTSTDIGGHPRTSAIINIINIINIACTIIIIIITITDFINIIIIFIIIIVIITINNNNINIITITAIIIIININIITITVITTIIIIITNKFKPLSPAADIYAFQRWWRCVCLSLKNSTTTNTIKTLK